MNFTNSNTEKRSAKIFFSKEDIRRINFNSNISFSDFRNLVKKLASTSGKTEEFRIRYQDEENDLITVETEEEWLTELSISPINKPLRITIEFKKPAPSQQSNDNPLFQIINDFQNLFGKNNENQNQNQNQTCGQSPFPKKNFGVICDGCDTADFEGERYKCNECKDFDFCEKCYVKRDELKHDSNHTFTQVNGAHPFFGRRGCRGGWRRHCHQNMPSDINFGITCDGCGTKNFRGLRYKCESCSDFDFCEGCFLKRDELKHDPNHAFLLIEKPIRSCPYFARQQQQAAQQPQPTASSEPVIQQQDQPRNVEEKPVDENEIEVVYSEEKPKQQENVSENKQQDSEPIIPPVLPQSQPQQQQQQQGRFNWWNQFFQPVQQQQQPFAYEEQLKTMKEMGFLDVEKCVRLLNKWSGNTERAINHYFDTD